VARSCVGPDPGVRRPPPVGRAYEEALAAAAAAGRDTTELFVAAWSLSELIEAAVRTENAELAERAFARLGEHTQAGTPTGGVAFTPGPARC
jgi:hypothetical protein